MMDRNRPDSAATEVPLAYNPATHIAIALVIVVSTMTACAFLAKFEVIPWTTLIFVAGTVGGVVNSFRRIQSLSQAKVQDATVMTGRLVAIQIYVSPFVGGVFAIVLYAMFMSGLVEGTLVPAFASSDEAFSNFGEFASTTMPATNSDLAKAIVWAFIAGFSEGLVPNFISKLAKEKSSKS